MIFFLNLFEKSKTEDGHSTIMIVIRGLDNMFFVLQWLPRSVTTPLDQAQ